MSRTADPNQMAFVRRAAPGLLISTPNTIQFGHLGMEMVMALAKARAERSAIAFIREPRVVNDGPFEFESPDVRIRTLSPPEHAWWRFWWEAGNRGRNLADRWFEARLSVWKAVGERARQLISHPRLSGANRDRMRALKSWARTRQPEQIQRSTPYLKRQLIRTPVAVRFRRDAHRRLETLAAHIGVAPEQPIVAVHAREPGWKLGREVQDKPLGMKQRLRDDSTRNVDIETFFPALDFLVQRGFTVIRLGDPTMCKVSRQGVIDLAHHPERTPSLDVYVLLRSRFLLGGESGPTVFTLLTNTPTLTVNATDPVSSYPIRADWMFILKAVVERHSGRRLSLREMAGERYLEALRDTTEFDYSPNSPDEILEATKEMLAFLERPVPLTERQRCFHDLLVRTSREMSPNHRYIRKWAADGDFLGDGRVANFYAERYFG